jgi:serine phosphatase RsbU (regulator of sigma subunit)
MLRYAGLSADLIARNLIWDIRRFAGLADQADDITLVVAKVK